MVKLTLGLSYLIIIFLVFFVGFQVYEMNSVSVIEPEKAGLILNTENAFDGYTLFYSTGNKTAVLINNEGKIVHTWGREYVSHGGIYLLEDGSLLQVETLNFQNEQLENRSNYIGYIQKLAWNGTPIWEFEYNSSQFYFHHDLEQLPNGNVLLIAQEHKDAKEVIAVGQNTSSTKEDWSLSDYIVEIKPIGATGGEIVWEWHVWDHLVQDHDASKETYGVVADHPELIDVNFDPRRGPRRGHPDWNHINSIDYNEKLDQIILSPRVFSEIWVIDHSTTTEEAAGHTGGNSGKGGDLLYRWGNQKAYGRGNASDQTLFFQHDAQWIEPGLSGEGNILVFNNGLRRSDGDYSSVDEIVPPIDDQGNYVMASDLAYGPDEPVWTYTAENRSSFFSSYISGVQRLPNGNTLICSGANGRFFEVTHDKKIVWEYINPFAVKNTENRPGQRTDSIYYRGVFKIWRYAPDFPGLIDKDLE